jgi:hypothetical protein
LADFVALSFGDRPATRFADAVDDFSEIDLVHEYGAFALLGSVKMILYCFHAGFGLGKPEQCAGIQNVYWRFNPCSHV